MKTDEDRARLWRRIALAVWVLVTLGILTLGYLILFTPKPDETAQLLPRTDTTEVIAAPRPRFCTHKGIPLLGEQ